MITPFVDFLVNGVNEQEPLPDNARTFFPRFEPYEEDDFYMDPRTGTRWLTIPANCDVSDSLAEIFSLSPVSCSKDGCNICVPSFHWNLVHPNCDLSTVTVYCCEAHCERFERIQFCFAGKVADVYGMQQLDTALEDTLAYLASKWGVVDGLRLTGDFVEDGVNELVATGEISFPLPRHVTLRTHLCADTIWRVLRTIRPATEALLNQPKRILKVVFAEADVSGDSMEFIYYSLIAESPAPKAASPERANSAPAPSALEANRATLRIALCNVFGEEGCGVIFGADDTLRAERDRFNEWVDETFPEDSKPTVAERFYRKGDLISRNVRVSLAQVKPFPRGTETRDSLFGRLKDVSNVRDRIATRDIALGEELVEPGELGDSRFWLGPFYYNVEVGSLNDRFTREYFEEQHEEFPDAYPVGKREFKAFTKYLASLEKNDDAEGATSVAKSAKRSRQSAVVSQPRSKGGKFAKKVAVEVAPVASDETFASLEAAFIEPLEATREADFVVAPAVPAPEAPEPMEIEFEAVAPAVPAPQAPEPMEEAVSVPVAQEPRDEYDFTSIALYDGDEEFVCPKCLYKECPGDCNTCRWNQSLFLNPTSIY